MRASLVAWACALTMMGAAGCKDFHYYDVDVTFAGFTGSDISTIQRCVVSVTGAETFGFEVSKNCPPLLSNSSEMGKFEYSSLADSGTLTFDMKVYDDTLEVPSCLFGEGMTKPVNIGQTTTVPEVLVVDKTTNVPAGCK